MTRRRSPFVLFAAAAGPELGFGHLVRAGVLADALGARRELALRGSAATTAAAVRLGWTVHRGAGLVDALLPDLVVIDDPSPAHRERWVRLARAARIPAAVIADGDAGRLDADLVVDGGWLARPDARRHRVAGPEWVILSRGIALCRARRLARDRRRVLVALGGGLHVRRLGVAVAADIVRAFPDVRVDLAAGFVETPPRRLPAGCRWLHASDGLAEPLATATVAVVAGGLTLYEACALGTPTVAVPVVAAQRPAIDAAAGLGAVRTAGRVTPPAITQAVGLLLDHPGVAAVHAAAAARAVDARGADRAAARLLDLVDLSISRGVRHAA